MPQSKRQDRDDFVKLKTSFGFIQKSHEDLKNTVEGFEDKLDKKLSVFLDGIKEVEARRLATIEERFDKLRFFIFMGEYPKFAVLMSVALFTVLVKEGRDAVLSMIF